MIQTTSKEHWLYVWIMARFSHREKASIPVEMLLLTVNIHSVSSVIGRGIRNALSPFKFKSTNS